MTTRTIELDRVIAANILFYRQERRWTQQRLAAALGISFQQLQKIERGTNRLTAARLFLIADVLGVPIQAFREPRLRNQCSVCNSRIPTD